MNWYSCFIKFIFMMTLISTVSLFGFIIYITEVLDANVSVVLVVGVMLSIAATVGTAVFMFKKNERFQLITNRTEE